MGEGVLAKPAPEMYSIIPATLVCRTENIEVAGAVQTIQGPSDDPVSKF